MNGYTLQTGRIARQEPQQKAESPQPKLPVFCFILMLALAIALASAEVARAETVELKLISPAALPEPVNFLTGMVAITWVYRTQDNMPFTEHHAITSAHVAEAIESQGPVRVQTSDEGELLIGTQPQMPGVLVSARRYADWTLVSVLRYENDPSHSHGVFKFCSQDDPVERCAAALVNQPDGSVTMTTGNASMTATDALGDLDKVIVENQLLALLNL